MPAASVTNRARLALSSGDHEQISAAVAADPDIAERAAIREYEGGMSRRDAEVAALQDALDEIDDHPKQIAAGK